MAHYENQKKHHMWFPRVNYITDESIEYDDIPETMIVEDKHQTPYIGDFPPENEYDNGIYY